MDIYGKELKPYKGFDIKKTWELDRFGNQTNVCYTAYTDDGYGVYDSTATLAELKKKIDAYLK